MAMKTCIKKWLKYLIVSTEFLESITKDENLIQSIKKEIKEVNNEEQILQKLLQLKVII